MLDSFTGQCPGTRQDERVNGQFQQTDMSRCANTVEP